MNFYNIIEIHSSEIVYGEWDVSYYYPGFRTTWDDELAAGFNTQTGELLYLYSFKYKNDRNSWNKIDINNISKLEVSYIIEDLYYRYLKKISKISEHRFSKEVLDYLLSEDRITKEYYEQEINK